MSEQPGRLSLHSYRCSCCDRIIVRLHLDGEVFLDAEMAPDEARRMAQAILQVVGNADEAAELSRDRRMMCH